MILSLISRVFDPLGFLCPFVITLKCIFQNVWRLCLDWNEIVPEEVRDKVVTWMDGLRLLREWKIPRQYFSEGALKEATHCQLHAFGDASARAYGACVYMRVLFPGHSWCSSLVYAKGKVAPLKEVTLPRLELMAALLCARLLSFVREALHLPESTVCYCWTDSTVVLHWILRGPKHGQTFVDNRIREILQVTDASVWRHCSGVVNPADCISRGVSAESLQNCTQWLKGPDFLSNDDMFFESFTCRVQGIKENVSMAVDARVEVAEPLFPVERWGGYLKAIRVVAWVLRFCFRPKLVQSSHDLQELTFDELQKAKMVLIQETQKHFFSAELKNISEGKDVPKSSRISQLNPFIGDDKLLRMGSRLQMAKLSYTAKYPIILPKCHLSVLIARHFHVSLKHAGVNSMLVRLRDEFWIIGARQMCKRVKACCVRCRRMDAPAITQPMAPLPRFRVCEAPVFSSVGIDHAGPLFCNDSGKKLYMLLFTCSTVRAVHIEVVDSLSTSATLQAIRRFSARRGMPSLIVSDNAKGFVSAQKLLSRGPESPDWQFIVPRGPWWGGFWERMIGLVKSSLRKTLGRSSISRCELETLLCEIEACINSRPLTFSSDDPLHPVPLTPSHFLIGRPLIAGPVSDPMVDQMVDGETLRTRWERRRRLADAFWRTWSEEYIRYLPAVKGTRISELRPGTLVLIHEDGWKRMDWPLGVVERTYPGRDGIVRSVTVKTRKGQKTRPIQRLHKLELDF